MTDGARAPRQWRSRVEAVRRLPLRVLRADELERERLERETPVHAERPRTRGDCAEGPRPCPWVSCPYHLFLDVSPRTGSIKLAHPGREPGELVTTCALDVAEAGGLPLEEVAQRMNLTRERVRQIEAAALAKLGRGAGARDLAGEVPSPRSGVRLRGR